VANGYRLDDETERRFVIHQTLMYQHERGWPTMELMQGTLDGLILKGLTWGPRHGYAVARWIEEVSGNSLTVLDGALYTALHRMEASGWIAGEWGLSGGGRRVKFYRLTPSGRRHLQAEMQGWTAYASAVGKVFRATAEPA
jgi:transcriptional regulator